MCLHVSARFRACRPWSFRWSKRDILHESVGTKGFRVGLRIQANPPECGELRKSRWVPDRESVMERSHARWTFQSRPAIRGNVRLPARSSKCCLRRWQLSPARPSCRHAVSSKWLASPATSKTRPATLGILAPRATGRRTRGHPATFHPPKNSVFWSPPPLAAGSMLVLSDFAAGERRAAG